MFKEIDLENWSRKETFEFFKDFEDPFFNITGNLDVTNLVKFCKDNNLSFSLSNLFYSLETANEIKEFRIRLKEDKLIEFDKIHATQTILNEDETFSFCYFEMKPDIFSFNEAGKESVEKYKKLQTFDVETERIDLIYYSVIPWISFTSFKHASRFDNKQSVPRIVFGKTFNDGEKLKMPVSVEVHHAIMDGFHVGKFFDRLQNRYENPV